MLKAKDQFKCPKYPEELKLKYSHVEINPSTELYGTECYYLQQHHSFAEYQKQPDLFPRG